MAVQFEIKSLLFRWRSRVLHHFRSTHLVARLDALQARSELSIGISVLNACLFAIIAGRQLPRWELGLWFGLSLLVALARMGIKLAWRQLSPAAREKDISRWVRRFTFSAGFAGSLWGIVGLHYYFLLGEFGRQTIILLLVAQTSAAVLSYGYLRRVFWSYLLPLIAPLALRLLASSVPQQNLFGLLLFCFSGILVVLAERLRRELVHSLELTTENQSLVGKIEYQNSELKMANDQLIDSQIELAQAAKARGDFLAVMTHELRTPLSGIIGLSQLIRASNSLPEIKELMGSVHASATSLMGLINNILDLSKIDRDEMELEWQPVDAARLVDHVVRLLSPAATEKNLRLKVEWDPALPKLIMGDVVRLQQVLVNLANNAMKFTQEGGIIFRISAVAISEGECAVEFGVRDTGIGIPENVLPRLFAKYSQADSSTTRKYGGTGLGLAICKGIVERMGGKIWVESEPGKGSEFKFQIRTALAPNGAVAVNSDSGEVALVTFPEGLRVLIVEDNAVNRLVAERLLQTVGVSAAMAEDGMFGKKALQQDQFDLLLIDMMMPNLDGMGLLEWIRESGELAYRPYVVILTASAMSEERDRALAVGADLYLSKPLTREKLGEISRGFRNSGVSVRETFKPELLLSESQAAPSNGLVVEKSDQENPIRPALDTATIQSLQDLGGSDNPDFLRQLIAEYFLVAEKALPRIEVAIAHGDAAELKSAAHWLKGSSRNLGALVLTERLQDLENCGKAKDLAPARFLHAKMLVEYEKAAHELRRFTRKAA